MDTSPRINYIEHLTAFYQRSRKDDRLTASDISLYLALFHIWNFRRFKNPFPVSRTEAMQLSHIATGQTYNHCLRTLEKCGYIVYIPQVQPFRNSSVGIQPLTKINTYAENDTHMRTRNSMQAYTENDIVMRTESNTPMCTGNDTPCDAKSAHFTKQYKQFKNESKQTRTREKSRIKAPEMEEVKRYFISQGQSITEGARFFYYYQSIGWAHRGNPIFDWTAAAQKWISNIADFSRPARQEKPNPLHNNQNKNYAEPL